MRVALNRDKSFTVLKFGNSAEQVFLFLEVLHYFLLLVLPLAQWKHTLLKGDSAGACLLATGFLFASAHCLCESDCFDEFFFSSYFGAIEGKLLCLLKTLLHWSASLVSDFLAFLKRGSNLFRSDGVGVEIQRFRYPGLWQFPAWLLWRTQRLSLLQLTLILAIAQSTHRGLESKLGSNTISHTEDVRIQQVLLMNRRKRRRVGLSRMRSGWAKLSSRRLLGFEHISISKWMEIILVGVCVNAKWISKKKSKDAEGNVCFLSYRDRLDLRLLAKD